MIFYFYIQYLNKFGENVNNKILNIENLCISENKNLKNKDETIKKLDNKRIHVLDLLIYLFEQIIDKEKEEKKHDEGNERDIFLEKYRKGYNFDEKNLILEYNYDRIDKLWIYYLSYCDNIDEQYYKNKSKFKEDKDIVVKFLKK